MGVYEFIIIFRTGKREIVSASNFTEAAILAQAEQIKKGNDYEILTMTNTDMKYPVKMYPE